MKTKITLLSAISFLLGACATGSYVTNSYDDIYYSPDNAPLTVVAQNATNEPSSASYNQTGRSSATTIKSIQDNENNSNVMENYIFQDKDSSSDVLSYNMKGMELVDSDTTVLSNDSVTNYVINNYYDADDINYIARINRFHRFGFYDPFFWDSWIYDPFYYDPWAYNYYWPGSFGIGFGSYGWGMGFGFNYGWNYPYYSYYGGYPYYGGFHNWGHNYWGYYPGKHHHEYYSNREYRPRGNRSSYYTTNRGGSTHPQVRAVTDLSSVSGRKSISSSDRRSATSPRIINNTTIFDSRKINNSKSNSVKTNSAYTGNRTSNSAYRSSSLRNTTSVRGVSSNGRTYTPSYTKPRTVTQSSYNTRSSTRSSSSNSSSVKSSIRSVRSSGNSSFKRYTPAVKSSSSNYSTRSSSSYSSGSRSIPSNSGSTFSGSSHSVSRGGSPRR